MRINLRCLAWVAAACLSGTAVAEMVTLTSVKDNTLQKSTTGAKANGRGQFLFVGKTAESVSLNIRRPVIQFDVSSIPAGSTVTQVYFTLYCSKAITAGPVSCHRCLSPWNEGTAIATCSGNNEGCGANSLTGDSTWIHRVKPGTLWTSVGGDFAPVASDTKFVEGQDIATTWGTSAGMVADVQAWVNNPSSNNGWLLVGEEIADGGTAKRFNTRENTNASTRPTLVVHYNPPTTAGDVNCSSSLNSADIQPFVTLLIDPDAYEDQFPGCPQSRGDMNGDTVVNGADIQGFATALTAP